MPVDHDKSKAHKSGYAAVEAEIEQQEIEGVVLRGSLSTVSWADDLTTGKMDLQVKARKSEVKAIISAAAKLPSFMFIPYHRVKHIRSDINFAVQHLMPP